MQRIRKLVEDKRVSAMQELPGLRAEQQGKAEHHGTSGEEVTKMAKRCRSLDNRWHKVFEHCST